MKRKNHPIINRPNLYSYTSPLVFSTFFLLLPLAGICQSNDNIPASFALKRLSLEELMDIEVTSVSKRPEKLSEAASAVQVITRDDIRNSGAKTLPEALRLAPNL